MNFHFVLFARGGPDSAVNQWLDKNPLVLGLLLLAIGGALAYSGVKEFRAGVAHDKYGNEIKGGLGKFTSVFRVVGGVAAMGFGVYKMIGG